MLLQTDLEDSHDMEFPQPRHDHIGRAGGDAALPGIMTVT